MKKALFILLIFLFAANYINAQKKYKRKITVSEWIDEMVTYEKNNYVLVNTEIIYNNKTDSVYGAMNSDDSIKHSIECYVDIIDCKFPMQTFSINGLSFKKSVFIMQCDISNININYCQFKEGLEILWGNLGLMSFSDCVFNDAIDTYEAEISVFSFRKCRFNASSKKVKSNINVNTPDSSFKSILSIASPSASKKINNLQLDSCQIIADGVTPVFYLLYSEFNTVELRDIDFKNTILDFETSSIEKTFNVVNCEFNKPIGMNSFNFPEKGTNFHWDQIKDVGIAIYTDNLKSVYTAAVDSQLTDIPKYNELISAYKNLYSMYRTRGDMESANLSYMAMKDVETRRLAYLYRETRNMDTYFNWKLNQFLKFFCKYGTSPIRALIISMWVILGFAIIYFFFDSEWDKINREYLLKKYKALLMYFQSDKKLADYYSEKHNIELNSYNEFKEYLKSSSGNIPDFMIWLGKPLYRFSTTRRMLSSYVFSKVEILDGEWNSLKPKRKMFVNIITVAIIIFFIIYAFLSKAINSLFLSINSFSTLGFGRIPVRGISRYLAILQGFLGWFLLSIFSVSLINQILQS